MGLLEKGGMETDYPASKACRLPEVRGPESSNMRARFSVAPTHPSRFFNPLSNLELYKT